MQISEEQEEQKEEAVLLTSKSARERKIISSCCCREGERASKFEGKGVRRRRKRGFETEKRIKGLGSLSCVS